MDARERERERREVKSGATRSYFRSRRSASGPRRYEMTDLSKFYCETNRKWFGHDRNTSSPLCTGVRKFTPSNQEPFLLAEITSLGRTSIHSRLTPLFTVHCFSFQPLPSPFPSWPRQLFPLLLFSILLLLSFVSFVDTRLSRWLQEQSPSTTSSYSLLLSLPLPKAACSPSSFNYSDDSSRSIPRFEYAPTIGDGFNNRWSNSSVRRSKIARFKIPRKW